MHSWALVEEVALDFGPPPRADSRVRRMGSRGPALDTGWEAVREAALDFGQPAPRAENCASELPGTGDRVWRSRYREEPSPEDLREIRASLEGYFAVLSEWTAAG